MVLPCCCWPRPPCSHLVGSDMWVGFTIMWHSPNGSNLLLLATATIFSSSRFNRMRVIDTWIGFTDMWWCGTVLMALPCCCWPRPPCSHPVGSTDKWRHPICSVSSLGSPTQRVDPDSRGPVPVDLSRNDRTFSRLGVLGPQELLCRKPALHRGYLIITSSKW